MNVEKVKEILKLHPGLEKSLGMEFISTDSEQECIGIMPVDERNMQPFGFLSGGAVLALAETLAGIGSCSLNPKDICVGMNVTCNHLHSAVKGDTVTGIAKIIHRGRQTHVWQVEVRNQQDVLISTISVTNFIIKK